MAISRYTPRSASRSTPQMCHGIYIMGYIWQPFLNLQGKVGISFYFWIIRIVNSQLALYSHVICNPFDTPRNTPKTPPHDNYNYNEGSYLPDICNIVVKADLDSMYHGMGCIWQPFWILQEKGGISYFWIIRLVNSQLALYSHVRCNPPQHPKNPKSPPTWQYTISTLWTHICQV